MANLLIIERALDGNGNVAAGAKATVYLTGTTTLASVFSDKDGTIPAANPIIADASGFWPQRFVNVTPKIAVTRSDDVTLYTLDPAPVTFGTGAAAAGVSFAPTVEVPESNVQDAIESVAATVVGGLTAFGIGVTGNAPLLANIDATGTASGVYRWDGASTGTFPAGITASTTGLIDFDRQTAAEGMQTLRALGQTRSYQRFLTSTVWGAWREVPSMTDPGANRVLGWDDTANAFAWFPPGQYTWMTPQATTSGTQFDFTGIPAGVTEIIVALSRVSLNGTDSVRVQLGDASSFETTGYDGAQVAAQASSISTASAGTAGFNVPLGNAANAAIGFLHILRPFADNEWVSSVNMGLGAQHSWSAQTKTLTGTLTRVRITRAASDTFDGGRVNVGYR